MYHTQQNTHLANLLFLITTQKVIFLFPLDTQLILSINT